MRGETAYFIEAPAGAACPTVLTTPRGEAIGVCLAAGHSDETARQVATHLETALAQLEGPPSASALAEILRDADLRFGTDASVASALLVLTSQRLFGAVVGRVRVLLVGADAPDEEVGRGKPAGVGSGRAQPVAFSQPVRGRSVVLGTESAFERADPETLFAAARDATPGRVVARLAEFARDEAGELTGAVALLVHRPAEQPVQRSAGRPRILFAEAHEGFVHSVTRSVLRDFEVVARGRVGDALDAIAATPFDLVLVDYDLADEPGDVLVRALRERGFTAPIIAVSAKDSANETLVQAGANQACSKLAFGQIADVIRSLLIH